MYKAINQTLDFFPLFLKTLNRTWKVKRSKSNSSESAVLDIAHKTKLGKKLSVEAIMSWRCPPNKDVLSEEFVALFSRVTANRVSSHAVFNHRNSLIARNASPDRWKNWRYVRCPFSKEFQAILIGTNATAAKMNCVILFNFSSRRLFSLNSTPAKIISYITVLIKQVKTAPAC